MKGGPYYLYRSSIAHQCFTLYLSIFTPSSAAFYLLWAAWFISVFHTVLAWGHCSESIASYWMESHHSRTLTQASWPSWNYSMDRINDRHVNGGVDKTFPIQHAVFRLVQTYHYIVMCVLLAPLWLLPYKSSEKIGRNNYRDVQHAHVKLVLRRLMWIGLTPRFL